MTTCARRAGAGLMQASDSCSCFNLCTRQHARHFLERARGASIRSKHTPWYAYVSAVYAQQVSLPFKLSAISLFYQNTPRWRKLWPQAASPFKDCSEKRHRQCSKHLCEPFRAVLTEPSGSMGNVSIFAWAPHVQGAALRATQLFSTDTDAFGRSLHADGTWVEVMRMDHRPMGFNEGMLPPNCSPTMERKLFGKLELPPCDWTHHPPGCFMRPAPGSGIWINTGKTRAVKALEMPPGVSNPVARDVLKAASDGVDTLQYQWGDVVDEGGGVVSRPPLLVSARNECTARLSGLQTCLPRAGTRSQPWHEARGGWHNLPCVCDEHLSLLNCLAVRSLAAPQLS